MQASNRMTVTLRSDGSPFYLIGTQPIPEQVMANRRVRKLIGAKSSNVLLLSGILNGESVVIEQNALLVRSFIPESPNERASICLAEQLVTNAIQFKVKDPAFAADQLAYADELLWLTWTGNMRYDGDRVRYGDVRMYDFLRIAPSSVRGAWNTYEPELG